MVRAATVAVAWVAGALLAGGCPDTGDNDDLFLYARLGDLPGGVTVVDARWGLDRVRAQPCGLEDTAALDWPGLPPEASSALALPEAWPRTDGAGGSVGLVEDRGPVRVGRGPWCRLELEAGGTLTALLVDEADNLLEVSLALPSLALELDPPLSSGEPRRLVLRLGSEDFAGSLASRVAAGGTLDVTSSDHEAVVSSLLSGSLVFLASDRDLTPVAEGEARGSVSIR